MRILRNKNKRITGQTALEYALVVGVISVGVIVAAKYIFGKDGAAKELMEKSVQSASQTIGRQ